MVNSFYDPDLEQGCAFEELISFHGGLGGPQTQPFILHPVELPMPAEPVVGAAAVHDLLMSWRRALHDGELASASAPALPEAPASTPPHRGRRRAPRPPGAPASTPAPPGAPASTPAPPGAPASTPAPPGAPASTPALPGAPATASANDHRRQPSRWSS